MLKKPSSKPRADIVKLAERTIADNGGPTLARVFYKYDCAECGSREVCHEPNVLPEQATCAVCGHVTAIRGAGFALHKRRTVSTPWDSPAFLVRKQYESDKGDA